MGSKSSPFRAHKAILVVLLWLLCVPFAQGQELWQDANLKIPMSQKWTLSFGMQYRMTDKFKATKRVAGSAGVSYKPFKFMEVDADYEFQRRHIGSKETPTIIIPSYWNSYHRVHMSVSLSLRIQSIVLSLRGRYAITHRCAKEVTIEDNNGLKAEQHKIASNTGQVFRTRAQIRWATANFPVDPFFNAEMFQDLTANFYVDRIRYTVGLNIKINSHNTIKPYYRFIDNLDGTKDTNVVGLSYEYAF